MHDVTNMRVKNCNAFNFSKFFFILKKHITLIYYNYKFSDICIFVKFMFIKLRIYKESHIEITHTQMQIKFVNFDIFVVTLDRANISYCRKHFAAWRPLENKVYLKTNPGTAPFNSRLL